MGGSAVGKARGTLIIVGGHEEKGPCDDRTILKEVARHARGPNTTLLTVTVATQMPDEVAAEYKRVFHALGVRHVHHLDLVDRADAHDAAVVRKVADASALFFTGGDQLRITSQVGDSPVFQCMHQR